MSVEQFTEKFTWEEGRFQKKSTLRDLVADIVKEVSKVDAQVKVQWTNYTGAVSQLSSLNRKAGCTSPPLNAASPKCRPHSLFGLRFAVAT